MARGVHVSESRRKSNIAAALYIDSLERKVSTLQLDMPNPGLRAASHVATLNTQADANTNKVGISSIAALEAW